MTSMPPFVVAGTRMSFTAVARSPARPSILGMEGPVISASRIPTRAPERASSTARLPQTNDLPTPPLPEMTPITWWILVYSFCLKPAGPCAAFERPCSTSSISCLIFSSLASAMAFLSVLPPSGA